MRGVLSSLVKKGVITATEDYVNRHKYTLVSVKNKYTTGVDDYEGNINWNMFDCKDEIVSNMGYENFIEWASTIPESIVKGMAESKGAETFNVEFNEWADQEMLTHGKDISFKDWAEDEGLKHGDVPITDWAEHEEESHDARYEAENIRNFEVQMYNHSDGIWETIGTFQNYYDAEDLYFDVITDDKGMNTMRLVEIGVGENGEDNIIGEGFFAENDDSITQKMIYNMEQTLDSIWRCGDRDEVSIKHIYYSLGALADGRDWNTQTDYTSMNEQNKVKRKWKKIQAKRDELGIERFKKLIDSTKYEVRKWDLYSADEIYDGPLNENFSAENNDNKEYHISVYLEEDIPNDDSWKEWYLEGTGIEKDLEWDYGETKKTYEEAVDYIKKENEETPFAYAAIWEWDFDAHGGDGDYTDNYDIIIWTDPEAYEELQNYFIEQEIQWANADDIRQVIVDLELDKTYPISKIILNDEDSMKAFIRGLNKKERVYDYNYSFSAEVKEADRYWDEPTDSFRETFGPNIEVREFPNSSSVYQNGKVVKKYRGDGHMIKSRSWAEGLRDNNFSAESNSNNKLIFGALLVGLLVPTLSAFLNSKKEK